MVSGDRSPIFRFPDRMEAGVVGGRVEDEAMEEQWSPMQQQGQEL